MWHHGWREPNHYSRTIISDLSHPHLGYGLVVAKCIISLERNLGQLITSAITYAAPASVQSCDYEFENIFSRNSILVGIEWLVDTLHIIETHLYGRKKTILDPIFVQFWIRFLQNPGTKTFTIKTHSKIARWSRTFGSQREWHTIHCCHQRINRAVNSVIRNQQF